MPLASGARTHGTVAGEFVLLDFPAPCGNRSHTPRTARWCTAKGSTGALYLDRPGEFAAYEKALVQLALHSPSMRDNRSS